MWISRHNSTTRDELYSVKTRPTLAIDVTYILNSLTIDILMRLSYDVLETEQLFLLCLLRLSILVCYQFGNPMEGINSRPIR
ncbi:hypothetical protein HZ326_21679 [Fusarium oxysporum f. sp. albedinis]|nr:hypothetical protein HZ326_21679 [Fusarium oxysporum f. sp. albedinis]